MGNQESAPSSSSQKQVLREHNKQPKKKVPMAYHNTEYSQQNQRYNNQQQNYQQHQYSQHYYHQQPQHQQQQQQYYQQPPHQSQYYQQSQQPQQYSQSQYYQQPQQQPQQYYQHPNNQYQQQHHQQNQHQNSQQYYDQRPPVKPPQYNQQHQISNQPISSRQQIHQVQQNAGNNMIAERNMLGQIYQQGGGNGNGGTALMPYPVSTTIDLNPYNFNDEVEKFKGEIETEKVKFNEEEKRRRKEFDTAIDNKKKFLDDQIKMFETKYNPYHVLGLVDNDNNLANIKKAYKKMALKYHPDKVGDGYTKEFQLVTQSYIYLLNKVEQMDQLNAKMNKKVEFVDYVDDINENVENIHVSKDKFDINQFNKIFEKYKIPDSNDDGYGNLYKEDLKSSVGSSSGSNNIFGEKFNKEVFNTTFEQTKKKMSSDIIQYQEPEAIFAFGTAGFTELGAGRVEDFSGSNYTDYKKAHVDETMLIDINSVKYKQYNSVEQLEKDRANISYKASDEDIIRYSHLEKMKKQKEDDRLRQQLERDELIKSQYQKLNNKLIVHK